MACSACLGPSCCSCRGLHGDGLHPSHCILDRSYLSVSSWSQSSLNLCGRYGLQSFLSHSSSTRDILHTQADCTGTGVWFATMLTAAVLYELCLTTRLTVQALVYGGTFCVGIYAVYDEPWLRDTSYFWRGWPHQQFS